MTQNQFFYRTIIDMSRTGRAANVMNSHILFTAMSLRIRNKSTINKILNLILLNLIILNVDYEFLTWKKKMKQNADNRKNSPVD